MNLTNSKLRIVGALLAFFGVLQMMSTQIQTLLSPAAYGWYTIAVGVVVFVLGVIKKGNGSFLNANRTSIVGVVLAILGGLQQYTNELQALLSPNLFTLFNIVVGAGLAVLGYLNAQGADTEDSAA